MATQPGEGSCEVVVWDYDSAPDGEGIVVHEVKPFRSRTQAKNYAWWMVNGDLKFVGAAVFRNGVKVIGHGLTFEYPS